MCDARLRNLGQAASQWHGVPMDQLDLPVVGDHVYDDKILSRCSPRPALSERNKRRTGYLHTPPDIRPRR